MEALDAANVPALRGSLLFPHLAVAAGNTSRAAFEAVARRGDVAMPRHTPWLLSGDFVRAEGSSAASPVRARNGSGESGPSGAPASGAARASDGHRPLKKDDVLSTNNAILRLQSTKKSQWQQ